MKLYIPVEGDKDRAIDSGSQEIIGKTTHPEEWAEFLKMCFAALRQLRLQRSDWTQVADCALSAAKQAEWATYRQALRDMPTSMDFTTLANEDDFNWPPEPV